MGIPIARFLELLSVEWPFSFWGIEDEATTMKFDTSLTVVRMALQQFPVDTEYMQTAYVYTVTPLVFNLLGKWVVPKVELIEYT